jgi:hypothetical protein
VKSVSRAAASEPDVHHDTTSSWFVDVDALVGGSEPQAVTVKARAAAAVAVNRRVFTARS